MEKQVGDWKAFWILLKDCVVFTLAITLLSFVEVFLAIGMSVFFGLAIPSVFSIWLFSMCIYFLLLVTGIIDV